MQHEHANVRTAIEFCLSQHEEVHYGAEIVTLLRDYWRARGLMSEARRWCERLLNEIDSTSPARADVLATVSYLALLQTDLPYAERTLAEGQQLARALGATPPLANVGQAFAAMQHRNYQMSITTCERVVSEHAQSDDPSVLATGLVLLGLSASLTQDSERATDCWNRLLSLCSTHGEQWRRAYALWGLGLERWRQGHLQPARELVQESITGGYRFNDRHCTALCIETLAWIATAERRYDESARLSGAAHMIRQQIGDSLIEFLREYHRSCEDQARSALGDSAYQQAFDDGLNSTFNQAVTLARGSDIAIRHHAETSPSRTDFKSVLTPREKQICELVARGRNKEIAGKLVVSPRTVESHVDHILVKLGFTSRTQITAWFIADRQERSAPEDV